MSHLTLSVLGFFLLSACGRSTPLDFNAIYGLPAGSETSASLLVQNRYSLQTGWRSGYVYTPPDAPATAPEAASPDLSLSQPDTDTAAPTNPVTAPGSTPAPVSPSVTAEPAPKPKVSSLKALPTVPPPVYPQAPDFSLETLDGSQQRFAFPSDRPLILAFADQKGAEQMEAWITPLYKRYTEQVAIHGIAELGGVPGFARGMVRGIIAGLVDQPIMLDWNGAVSKKFGVQKNVTNIFVLDASGQILAVQRGPANLDKLKAIVTVLDPLVKAQP
ncbi:MAG: hypothetical protein IGS03_11395 [Candidatus Sericytochromatia bacterium]|nr:hypothetical protein [Candidatus Sericytochromatia bacterium]